MRMPESGIKFWSGRRVDCSSGENYAKSEDDESVRYLSEQGSDEEEEERNHGPESIIPDWNCPSKRFDQS